MHHFILNENLDFTLPILQIRIVGAMIKRSVSKHKGNERGGQAVSSWMKRGLPDLDGQEQDESSEATW